jgi:hypothetical protein
MSASDLRLGAVTVRGENTAHKLKCDAIAVDREGPGDGRIMLLSAAGSATQVKSLVAALRSKARVTFHPEMPPREVVYQDGEIRHERDFHCWKSRRYDSGYRVYRTRLDGDYWHVLLVADVEGFLPILDEDTLWQELRDVRFTTPLLREWVPWLMERMRAERLLVPLEQAGCKAGWLRATTEQLDELVSHGVKGGALKLAAEVA